MRRGLTIIELLIFIAIFSVVIVGIITVLITTVRVQSRQASADEVETQGQFLLQQIQYYVQSARLADMPLDAPGTLTLRESAASSSLDPTIITNASGTVYLQQGVNGTPQALTSNKVTVSNLAFVRHYNLNGSSSALGAESVSYSFTVTGGATNATQFYQQSFRSSASILAPVPKIALIQQAKTEKSGAGVTSISSTYPTGNEVGDLLLAVVSNTGTSNATTSVSDNASDTWTQVANPKYAAYNQETTIYASNYYPAGLIGYWKFDDGYGLSAIDSSIDGYNATLVNNPIWTVGKFGSALTFDNASNYAVTNSAFNIGSLNFTIVAWVSGAGGVVATQKASINSSTQWIFGGGNGYLEFYTLKTGWVGSYAPFFTAPGILFTSSGQWDQIAIVGTATTTSAYANGVLLGTASVSEFDSGSHQTPTNPLYIGYSENLASYFAGSIDDVRLYNQALTAAQIYALYLNQGITVTTNFGNSVSSPSLFLYEYRGAATSTATSFDASSTQTQANTANPSSGAANPTSAAELVFGTLYSNPSSETPAAGSGFTVETTSGVSATYVEDEDVFVTAPVSTNWIYSQTTPSSSATTVTFK